MEDLLGTLWNWHFPLMFWQAPSFLVFLHKLAVPAQTQYIPRLPTLLLSSSLALCCDCKSPFAGAFFSIVFPAFKSDVTHILLARVVHGKVFFCFIQLCGAFFFIFSNLAGKNSKAGESKEKK